MKTKHVVILSIAIIVYILVQLVSEFYVDYRWFSVNGQFNTFWTLFITKFDVQSIFTVLFVLLFAVNFILIRIIGGKGRFFTSDILNRLQLPFLGTPRRAILAVLAVSVTVVGIIMGIAASAYWKEYLMWRHGVPFTGFPLDPLFSMDIGFYVFSLPFYRFLVNWLLTALIVITVLSALFHVINGGVAIRQGAFELSIFTRTHLSLLLAVIVFIYGLSYRISAYMLVFADKSKFFGAGYTDVHARLLAYNACMIISFIAAGLLVFNVFKKSLKYPVIVMLTIIPVYFLLGTVYPSLQQRFVVDPNELDKERPFITSNINLTRIAYDLERIRDEEFPNNQNLTYKDIARNREVLENIRLWDWRPLKNTYSQIQALKPYYHFNDVDVDRYMIGGRKIAVNLAAREFSIDNLGKMSTSWVNQHLIYTHGYGLVLSRVDKVTPEGLPNFLVYDIPPKIDFPITIDRQEVYYGEHRNPYVIVNTNIQPGEFDYPHGEQNRYTRYAGTGGDRLDSFMKRLLFSVSFGNINILISGSITKESRILFRRNIVEMARTMAPFLDYDHDPYLVIADGRLYWILDAYTTTDHFPYSTPVQVDRGRRINYIRNSVKVVIDAYNGTISYYVTDSNDPLARAYSVIFQGLFKNFSDMPASLQSHIRYPEDMFNIQSGVLLRYHMKDVNVFYNNEDAWDIPNQIYDTSEERVQSYYLVTKLPRETRSEFILLLPFTPVTRDNMVAFLAAKCDMPHLGELTLYRLPKDRLSYGPMQIEAKINQDPEISKQLTLWSQKGTNVIRGNMLVLPVEESILFVEPLYLKAVSGEIPELRRVSVAFGERIVMEENLDLALDRLFRDTGLPPVSSFASGDKDTSVRDYAAKAYMYFMQAEQYQRQGQWAKYGEEIEKLRSVLSRMKDLR